MEKNKVKEHNLNPSPDEELSNHNDTFLRQEMKNSGDREYSAEAEL